MLSLPFYRKCSNGTRPSPHHSPPKREGVRFPSCELKVTINISSDTNNGTAAGVQPVCSGTLGMLLILLVVYSGMMFMVALVSMVDSALSCLRCYMKKHALKL